MTGPKDACGVFGVFAAGLSVAQLTYDGLYALQHRGQESAGMAVSDGDEILVVKDMGLVTTVFDERNIACLSGDLAIGHTRYSTTGASSWVNAQPVYRPVGKAGFALGHNGNLTNVPALAERAGMLPGLVASDSDLVAEMVALALAGDLGPAPAALPGTVGSATAYPVGVDLVDADRADVEGGDAAGADAGTAEEWAQRIERSHEHAGRPAFRTGAEPVRSSPDGTLDLEAALRVVLPLAEGAFSFVLMDTTRVIGVRDPHGLRPLCLGRLGARDGPDGWVLASETPALDVVGATFVRELEPGEMVVIDADGVRSEMMFPADQIEHHLCIFEFVYFARPDSRLYGLEVHGARRRMGELLAIQAPVDADMVMGVPESGVPAAEGFAKQSTIPYGQGLVKNRYIGRTFIAPSQAARADGVRRKLNPLRENIAGKRLVVVDDSIVRGTTQRAVVRMLREAGAAEVHLRICSPPLMWPCYYGIDIPNQDDLIAAKYTVPEIADYLDVDSLAYLSLENLETAIDAKDAGFCNACLTGNYPVA